MKTGMDKISQQVKTRPASMARQTLTSRGDSAVQRRVDGSAAMQRQRDQLAKSFGHPVQRAAMEDEELLQGKFTALQRQGPEEELLQGKFEGRQRQPEEEELMQGKFSQSLQRLEPEEEELMQGKFSQALPREQEAAAPNKTGMPDNLKQGVESLSGADMSAVRVHYNSSEPARLNAHAYAQGEDIHLGSGQEKHLPHEAWHVVQQQQGRVQPTMEMGGEKINDDAGLEQEADVMGEKALRYKK